MKTSRRERLIIVFALVTIITAVYAGAGLISYSRFFPAMSNMDVRLSTMDWRSFSPSTGDPSLEINASFTVMNPESYNGLALKSFKASLDISYPTKNTTIRQGSILHIPTNKPLDPQSPVGVDVPSFNATNEAAQLASQTSDIRFVFQIDLVLRSFLDSVGELRVSYECQSTGGPVACEQSEVVIITRPGASGGGDGA